MKNLSLRNGLLGLGLVSSLGIMAQPIVIEAEDPIESDQTSVATLDAEGSEASGLAGLSLDNAHRGSYAVYSVEVPEAGTYDLSVWYVTMNTRWLSIQVNDQIASLMACDKLSGGWNGVAGEVVKDAETGETELRDGVVSKSIKVHCNKGTNFITVKAIYGYSPEEGRDQRFAPTIDRFELVRSDSEIEAPRDWYAESDRIIRECENYDAVSGNASVSDRAAFSGKRGANISASGGTLTYNIDAPEEGVYLMEIWYSTCQRRWIYAKVNQQVPTYVSFADFSDGWGESEGEFVARRQVALYLKKGANTITLGQYTRSEGKDTSEHGDSPALDYFTLDLVSYPDMTEPEKEIAMYKHALSDIAEWKSSFDVNLISDHNEHTVATSGETSGTVTLEFPTAINMSGYAFATENNAEAWSVSVSADGENWNTPDVNSKSQNGVIYLCGTNYDRENPARFVRLEMNGSEAITLGDFAVFGTPENVLPNSLLEADAVDYETTHNGFDTGEWHEGIDKLFDGNPYSQFTVAGDFGQGDADDIVVTVYLPSEQAVKAYSLSVHDTSYMNRNPSSWELSAFDYEANDGEGNYVIVDEKAGMNFVVKASTLVIDVENPVSSDCYTLTLRNRRNQETHLSDFQLYTESFGTMSGVEAIDTATPSFAVVSGKCAINILSQDAKNYRIIDLAGKTVATGICNGNATIALNAGIYIVAIDGRSTKVLVK